MRRRFAVTIGVLTALAAVAAACTPTGGQTGESTEATQVAPTQVAPTEAAETAPTPETKTLFVGPELVDCTGVAPQKCLQVREDPDGEYQLFYSNIEGFTFEPGFEYELLVSVETVANPPADGSSLRYTLIEVVNKMPVATVEPAETAAGLEGTRWVLESQVGPNGETVPALPDREVTAEFSDGALTGSGGCNNYFGSYTVDGANLTIGQVGSTMMACMPEAIMQQETQFFANLQSAATYTIVDGQLQIADATGNVVLTFAATEPIALTGTTWAATGYNNGREAVVSVLNGTSVTAVFGEDGTLSGLAGCNQYTAGYTTDGETITIEPPASTRMFCTEPEGIMDQEAAYLAALPTAATYRIDGNKLELRTAGGALVATYIVAAPESAAVDPAVAEALANALLPLGYAGTETIQLTDGSFSATVADSSAEVTVTLVGEYTTFGMLADGREAAATILATQMGGSGTFYDLAVVPFENGQPGPAATAFLGDRVQLNSVSITDGQIVVDMITHSADDPMCCPTQHVMQVYALNGDVLELVSTVEVAS